MQWINNYHSINSAKEIIKASASYVAEYLNLLTDVSSLSSNLLQNLWYLYSSLCLANAVTFDIPYK